MSLHLCVRRHYPDTFFMPSTAEDFRGERE
jgi:hypothetical protein